MAERCPLLPGGLYWENETTIPDFCQDNCGDLMTAAITHGSRDGEYDVFVPDIGED